MARHKRKGTWMGHPLFDISGRIALITGSSRGIGRALAAGLLQAGCTVVLNARDSGRLERTRADLADLADLAGQTNDTVHAVAFDATSPEAVADGVARAEHVAGPLDILVNNAGAQRRANSLTRTGISCLPRTSPPPSWSAAR
jgi:gluconate 5-dehydrogenase